MLAAWEDALADPKWTLSPLFTNNPPPGLIAQLAHPTEATLMGPTPAAPPTPGLIADSPPTGTSPHITQSLQPPQPPSAA